MSVVWIAQCLCPDRHCILANAGTGGNGANGGAVIEAALGLAIATMLRKGELNPWCGLCHAKAETWRLETRRTRFATMAEAMPELRRLEAEQVATSAIFGDMPRSD